MLNCHPQSVYRNKELPRTVIPGVGLRFKQKELEKYLSNRTTSPYSSFFSDVPHNNDINRANHLLFTPGNPILYSGGESEMPKGNTKTRFNFGYGAIYVRKTKNGKIRWYLDYRNGNGKRIQKVAMLASTKEEAVFALSHEVAIVFNKTHGGPKQKERITFKNFAPIYLGNYAKVRKRSWRSDQLYIEAQLIPFFGEFTLSELSPFHVSNFMVKRQKEGVRNSTINRELTVLKKMLNLAEEWDYEIENNPVKKGNFFSEEEFKRDRVLSDEEERRLVASAAPHLKSIIKCALSTGMRYSENLGLRWKNVNLEKRQITIKAESSKSGSSRVIPINETLYRELLKLEKENTRTSDFVFLYTDPGTGKKRPIKTVRRAFTMACKRSDIKNLTFHTLRHTFGSRLIEKGADPVSVKNILGHANLKTTEIYLHSSIGQMKSAVELLDQKGTKSSQKMDNLLHIRDTNRKEEEGIISSALFSVN